MRPDLTLGDPNLIDTGPRPGTSDTANLDALFASANTIFDAIAAGGHDADIDQVFGHVNRATAKAKYANGKTWMNNLHASNYIVTDRSGYNRESDSAGSPVSSARSHCPRASSIRLLTTRRSSRWFMSRCTPETAM